MIKFIAASVAALFIIFAGYNYANAAPTVGDIAPTCSPSQIWPLVKEQLEAAEGVRLTQLNAEMITTLNEKMGTPPHTNDQPFDAFLVEQGEMGAVFIVQNGCAVDRLGPGPLEVIKRILGLSQA